MSEFTDKLVKIGVDIPNYPLCPTEPLWASPLGDDLYELRTTPLFAGHLNWYDVVRAVPEREGGLPRVVEVAWRGGHRTVRARFSPEVGAGRREGLLRQLRRWKASYKCVADRAYLIDVVPGGDFRAVCDQVESWGQQEWLTYSVGAGGEEAPRVLH